MIDLHSHIMPGIDDGARSFSEAYKMLQIAIDGGVTTQVLTPHIHYGRHDNTRKGLNEHFLRFKEKVDAENLQIELLLAAEMRIGPEIMSMIDDDELPYLGEYQGKKAFLLEFPRGEIPFGSENLVKWVLKRGYLPIIVHPERNTTFVAQRNKLKAFTDLGCLLQITASSLTGKFGSNVQIMAEDLLLTDEVSVIASDCHNIKGRAPDLIDGFNHAASILSVSKATALVETIPRLLVKKNISSLLLN